MTHFLLKKSATAVATAVLLSGVVSFTACNNKAQEEVQAPNPTYDGEAVKTQFAISIPRAAKTRMSAENTQNNNSNFLGMQRIKLYPYQSAATASLSGVINLGDINNTELSADDGVKVYSDLRIPVGTDHFLLYAEAKGSATATSNVTDKFERGVLNSSLPVSATSGDINFELVKVQENAASITIPQTAFLTLLNAVANANGWKEYETSNSDLLASLYTKYTQMMHSGAADDILATMQALYDALGAVSGQDELVNAIKTAMTGNGLSESGGTLSYTGDLTAYNSYPINLNLPKGAVGVKWNQDKFEYNNSIDVETVGTMDVNPAKICFPASLNYFVNTELKAMSTDVEFPNFANWKDGSWTGWESATGSVSASTMTIALTKPVNYSVANLALTVKCKGKELPDNTELRENYESGEAVSNNPVTVPADGFPVTGVLIGGQPDKVDYQFIPADGADNTMVIYDNAMSAGFAAKAETVSDKNYTLVLDNKAAEVQPVYIAVELKNTSGKEFYGRDGIVPNGGTFYLVGALNPDVATNKGDFSGAPYVLNWNLDWQWIWNGKPD